MSIYMKIWLIWVAVMSIVDFIMYGADKAKAKAKQWRTPEKTLLLTGFFGGAVGALLGMKVFRHKTKHWYFWAVNFVGLALHVTVTVFLSGIKPS